MRPLHALLLAAGLAGLLAVALTLSAWRRTHRDDLPPLAALELPRPVTRYDLAFWRRTRATDPALWLAAVGRCASAEPAPINCEPVRALLALDHLEIP